MNSILQEEFRLRDEFLRRVPLASEAIDVAAVRFAVFGVDGIFVAGGAACDKGSVGRVHAGDRAIRDAVVVDIEVATEFAAELLERLAGSFAAAIVARKIRGIVASSVAVTVTVVTPLAKVEPLGGL